jgi:hypothetical protein
MKAGSAVRMSDIFFLTFAAIFFFGFFSARWQRRLGRQMDERHTIRFYRPARRATRKILIGDAHPASRARDKKMKQQTCQSTRASNCLDSV